MKIEIQPTVLREYQTLSLNPQYRNVLIYAAPAKGKSLPNLYAKPLEDKK